MAGMASETQPTPPDAVEMPRPTVAPLVLALGMALLAAGVLFGVAFLVVGALVLVAGLAIWIAQLLPGRGHMHEHLAAPAQRAQPVTAAPGGVARLLEGMPGYRLRLPQDVHPISAGIKGGFAGAIAMPIPALIWGLVSHHSLFYPVNLLAGMVWPGLSNMGPEELEQYLRGFHLSLLLVAFVIHAVVSVVFGLIYGVLLPTLPSVPRPIAWGGLVMPIVWTGASYVAMSLVNPALPGQVNWPWFIVSQFVFGITMPAVVLGLQRLPALLAGAVGGLVGGAIMALPALLWAAGSGHGLWYPVNLLAGTVLSGPGSAPGAELGSFHADWFLTACAMHAALSTCFGILFALAIPHLRPVPAPVAWGGLVLPLLWTGASYGLMGVVNPVLQDRVDWAWFIVSQLVFGVAAAVVVLRSEMVHIPPAGPGR
jgi:hypothetical protein